MSATFVEAIVRLGVRGHAALAGQLDWKERAGFAVACVSLVYLEGHRALQRKLAPSVVARACGLSTRSRGLFRWLAPLYAVSLLGAERRACAKAWAGVGLIVLAVCAVRHLPEPWRGLIDGAVALALSWGLFALWGQFLGAKHRPPWAF